jgi:hypothetical protein
MMLSGIERRHCESCPAFFFVLLGSRRSKCEACQDRDAMESWLSRRRKRIKDRRLARKRAA